MIRLPHLLRECRPLFCKVSIGLFLICCPIWYARTHFYRDPGSVFFDKSRAYEQKYSQHRKAEVQTFVQQFTSSTARVTTNEQVSNRSLCVTIPSVRRQYTQYVETTVASALGGLLPEERDDLYLNVFIAHTNPNEHPTWHQDWVSRAVDDIYTYNVSKSENERLQVFEKEHNFAEKGVFDYTYALEQCQKMETPYIGIFEDDVMFADGWLVHLLSGLRHISVYQPDKPWLYLRMFNQERSTGWSSRRIGGNNEHWIILGVWLTIAPPLIFARQRWKAMKSFLNPGLLFVLLVILFPFYVVLFFQSGKASLWPPSRGVADEPFGCCSQIMIFPREQVQPLVQFLRSKGQGQIDLLLNDRAIEMGLTRYALYPVMAQHIGLDSARSTTITEAQAIWSMAFEDLEPETLRRDHRRMGEQYYGA